MKRSVKVNINEMAVQKNKPMKKIIRNKHPLYKPMDPNSKEKYAILNFTFTCESTSTEKPTNGNVYWTVLAGRRANLKLQEKYWVDLHKKGLITQVHLWDFTYRSKPEEGKLDQEWMHTKAKQHDFIRIFTPPVPPGRKQNYRPFYEYYAKNVSKDDVITKVDDDIVWVNVSEFKCFVQFVAESVDTFLVSANVVNNGVVAHFQQKLGSIPHDLGTFEYPPRGAKGRLWESPVKALKLHEYFVSHKSDFYREGVFQFRERISINFIGFTGRHTPEMVNLVKEIGADDEKALTTLANRKLKATEVVYMRLVTAHVTFNKQRSINPNISTPILNLYS